MGENRVVNLSGAILTTRELEEYLRKLGATHNVVTKSNKSTYPIPRLLDNYIIIKEVYNMLNEHVKMRNTNTSSRRMDFR